LRNNPAYIFFFIILILFHPDSFGQKQKPKNDSWYDDKPMHFGFSLGLNLMDFNITPSGIYSPDSLYPDVSVLNPGINIQIVTNLHLARYFDFRFLPGVAFGQRNVRYFKAGVVINEKQRLESSFLEFPFLLKYKGARLNNVRPYVIGGINYRYDLAGKKEYDDEKPVYLRIKRSDIYYEAGAGLDFYLPYFKLSVELKVSTGLRDVIVHEPAPKAPQFSEAISHMKSQIWILAFHFE
jgi:hypothetical protein